MFAGTWRSGVSRPALMRALESAAAWEIGPVGLETSRRRPSRRFCCRFVTAFPNVFDRLRLPEYARTSFSVPARPPAPGGDTVGTSWLTPSAELRAAGRKGLGVFAVAPIPRGESIAGFGGQVVRSDEFNRLDQDRRAHSLQIDTDLYLVSPVELEPADYLNHSCEPNAGLLGNIIVVAMTDIGVDEEICFDYAMCDAGDYDEFLCECGTQSCRLLVTGADWKRPELQARYAGYFSSYLANRITADAKPL
jgi:hypothetical protein